MTNMTPDSRSQVCDSVNFLRSKREKKGECEEKERSNEGDRDIDIGRAKEGSLSLSVLFSPLTSLVVHRCLQEFEVTDFNLPLYPGSGPSSDIHGYNTRGKENLRVQSRRTMAYEELQSQKERETKREVEGGRFKKQFVEEGDGEFERHVHRSEQSYQSW
ncbi:hypothetical protein J6590_084136 [Homalodisca vitripennis]|nr:hypothetical protein J6590_084136 [Homalodisca vitripennis]